MAKPLPIRPKHRFSTVAKTMLTILTGMAITSYLLERSAPLATRRLVRCRLRYLATPDGDICVQTYGDNPSTLLLHSLTHGRSAQTFDEAPQSVLELGYVAVDLIGYGRSDRPRCRYDASMYVDHVHQIMQETPTIKTIVAKGYSATIAILVQQQSESPLRVILVNPQYSPAAESSRLRRYLQKLPVLGSFHYHVSNMLRAKLDSGGIRRDDTYGNTHRPGSATVIQGRDLPGILATPMVASPGILDIIDVLNHPSPAQFPWDLVAPLLSGAPNTCP